MTRSRKQLEHRYADKVAKLAYAERQLARAFNRWNTLRLTVRRYERQLDKLQAMHDEQTALGDSHLQTDAFDDD